MNLLIALLATYGVTRLLVGYDAPFNLFLKLRKTRLLKKVLDCSVCASVWVAIPISYGMGIGVWGYLAVIGAFVLIYEHV